MSDAVNEWRASIYLYLERQGHTPYSRTQLLLDLELGDFDDAPGPLDSCII